MPLNIPLRQKIAAQEKVAGVWLTLPSTAVARTLASAPYVSWVLVDAEHGLINDTFFYDLNNTIASCGASPIVRIPSEEPWLAKRALDSGAHGIMVPLANSAEAVRKIVSMTKYPPDGIRGFGPMYTHATGKLEAEYKETANQDLLVAVQIEHPNAVKEIEEIVETGIDIAFIGPFDLAVSMGVEFGGEEHEEAIAKVLAACQKAGKAAGIYCVDGRQAKKRFDQGFQMASVTADISILQTALAAETGIATSQATETSEEGFTS